MRIKIWRIAALLFSWAMLFAAAVATPVSAQNSDQDRALRARQSGAADLPALRRMVEGRVRGTVVGVTPLGRGNNIQYRFKVLRGADVVSVTVNAKSGAITSIKEPR
ncbi:MAG: hypothetical protein ACFBZ9_06930 [Sphingomonadales bacterium]